MLGAIAASSGTALSVAQASQKLGIPHTSARLSLERLHHTDAVNCEGGLYTIDTSLWLTPRRSLGVAAAILGRVLEDDRRL